LGKKGAEKPSHQIKTNVDQTPRTIWEGVPSRKGPKKCQQNRNVDRTIPEGRRLPNPQRRETFPKEKNWKRERSERKGKRRDG